jgi:TIR domain-containing protein
VYPRGVAVVFVSYRRGDESGHARRLVQELRRPGLGLEVAMDADAVAPGSDVVAAIDGAVERADAVLAVIGPQWLTETDQHGRRHVDLASDHVRIELDAAQRHGRPVIPVLVGGAAMPEPEELPAALQWLARRSPLELRDAAFAADVDRLRKALVPLGPEVVAQAGGKRQRGLWIAAAVLALAVLGLGAAAVLANRDDGGGSSATETAASTAEATSTAEPASTEQGTTQQPPSTSEPPTTTTTPTTPDLSATIFQDDLTPPSSAFPDGPGPDGCTFSGGSSGYDIAAGSDATCTASGFLDGGDLPDAALTVTAGLPDGVNDPDPATRAVLECSGTGEKAYRATLAPDGAVALIRHAATDRSLASGTATGIDLTQAPVRLRLECTSVAGSTRVALDVDGRPVLDASDGDPLPAGQPTFGAARVGAGGAIALRFTDLVVEGPA